MSTHDAAGASAIRAAGVVLLRDDESGRSFLVVHRAERKDWSLPKGKLDPGEHLLNAAVRECEEETGMTPILQSPLRTLTYSVLSRPKVVNYWRARAAHDEGFTPDDEIDSIEWLPVSDAAARLTYPSDVALVRQADALPDTTPLVILRHTQAMKRSDFKGDADADRPLTGKGRSQAKAIASLIETFGVTEVRSSSSRRCTETVKRLARSVGTAIRHEDHLTEEAHAADATDAGRRMAKLAHRPTPLVVCVHRPTLPTILDALAHELGINADDPHFASVWEPKLPPGGMLVIHREFTESGVRATAVERHTLGAE